VASALTGRELELLHLLARGLTSKEIALALVVSVRTVEHHRA
jgi:DNA-binding NarL/FixJ family response regulator